MIDKFKHDIRDLIESARAEERSGIMNKLEAFIDTDGKTTDEKIVDFVVDKVRDFKPDVAIDIQASENPIENLTSDPPKLCEQCNLNPVGMHGYGSKKYCSKECGNRAIAMAQAERHRKKALSRQ